MRTRFDDRVPKSKRQAGQIVDVGMQGNCFFNDESIDIADMDLRGREIQASISFIVKYGVPENRKYTYSKDIEVIFHFDKEGIFTHHNWQDSIETRS